MTKKKDDPTVYKQGGKEYWRAMYLRLANSQLNSFGDPSMDSLNEQLNARPRHMTFGEFVRRCLNR